MHLVITVHPGPAHDIHTVRDVREVCRLLFGGDDIATVQLGGPLCLLYGRSAEQRREESLRVHQPGRPDLVVHGDAIIAARFHEPGGDWRYVGLGDDLAWAIRRGALDIAANHLWLLQERLSELLYERWGSEEQMTETLRGLAEPE